MQGPSAPRGFYHVRNYPRQFWSCPSHFCMWWILPLNQTGSYSVADPGFVQGRGANSPAGRQHKILPNFPKNCMKMKEFGSRGAFKILLCRSATAIGPDPPRPTQQAYLQLWIHLFICFWKKLDEYVRSLFIPFLSGFTRHSERDWCVQK